MTAGGAAVGRRESDGTAAAPARRPRAAAVVVAYRGRQWIDACVRALLATRYPDLQVLVVDNGSDDGTAAAAAACGEAVRVLALERNHGFAGGANRGIAAVAADADVVALVNQDCVVEPDWLDPLVAALSGDESIGVVGARLLDADGVTLQHAGGVVAANGLTRHLGRGAREPDAFSQLRDVDYVCGALIALRSATWRRLGGLDEGYFPAYFEEVDLCLSARAAGLRVVYVPHSRARHAEAASSQGAGSAVYLRHYHRGRMRLVVRHLLLRGRARAWLGAELVWLSRLRRWREIAPVLAAYASLPRLLVEIGREGSGA